ncbi:MAG: hypothetical protein IBX61_02735 [Thermoleophilia bacterium]|nr:hypothetical protein [Thermoleophilia bacterium]
MMTAKEVSAHCLRRLKEAGVTSLNGFEVEAQDGNAGVIDQVLYWSDALTPDFLIVGTRRWIFGHKAIIPVDVIEDVDVPNRRLRIRMNREQVRQAPESLPVAL